MQTFWNWLLTEERYERLPAGVLQGYEQAFKQALRGVIQRTKDPRLRATFQKHDGLPDSGPPWELPSFSRYIVDALIKNGIQHQYDMEAALAYVSRR